MTSRNAVVTPEAVLWDIKYCLGKFVSDPWRRLGDTDSAHGVLFGELDGVGQVAIKPYFAIKPSVNELRAAAEQRNLEKIRKAGFDALEPLGIAVGGLAAYLVTIRRNDLRHLGQLDWRVNVAAQRLGTVIEPTLRRAASAMAAWHNAGITHGDAQVKNVAFDATGKSVYIDAERTGFNHVGDLRQKMVRKDLSLFGTSALARGLLYDRSASYRTGFLREALLDPYFDVAQPGGGQSRDAQKVAIEQKWVHIIEQGYVPQWAIEDQLAAKDSMLSS